MSSMCKVSIWFRGALTFIAPVALPFLPSPAHAWGTAGHHIVCQIAWQETTDNGRALVQQLLGVSDPAAFARTCTWADDVRDMPGFSWSKPHHFIEPARGATFDVVRDCPDGGCAPRAIGQQARIVVDAQEPAERRAEALEFVAHFVGDVHQPLHAGFSNDLGGNTINVTFCPQGCIDSVDNLHKVWDSGILAMNGSEQKLIDALRASLTASERDDWKGAPVDAWATEAHGFAESHAYHLVKNGAPDSVFIGDRAQPVAIRAGYLPVMTPIAEQQLKRAAVRLAVVLDALSAGNVPPTLTTVPPRFIEPSTATVTLRASANSTGASVTHLSAGDRAELLGIESAGKNKPQFYRVRMKDGTQGYVAKKDGRVVAQ